MKQILALFTLPLIGLSAAAMLTTSSCSAQDVSREKRVEQRLVEYIANWERNEKEAGPDNCARERANSKVAAAKYALSTLRTEFKLPKP